MVDNGITPQHDYLLTMVNDGGSQYLMLDTQGIISLNNSTTG